MGNKNKKKKEFFQKLLLLFLTLTVTLSMIEGSLRLFLPDELKYATAPGQKKWVKLYATLNNEGYRDTEHSLKKDKDTIRVIGLGDSFAFGIGIKNSGSLYLAKLENLLNKNLGKKYEVLNMAKIGVGTSREIEILKKDGLKYKPDIIVVGYFLNDFEDVENVGKIRPQNAKFFNPIKFFIYDTFYSYYFYDRAVQKFGEIAGIRQDYPTYLKTILSSKKNIDSNTRYLEDLAKISRENNAILIVVVIPVIHEVKNYPFVEANKFIEDAGKKYNFAVIDLLPYFKNYNESELWVSRYDHHMNELGHEITARAIYEKIMENRKY